MSQEEPLRSLNISQAEKIVLQKLIELGLEEMEGLRIHSVKIDFGEVDLSEKKVSEPFLSEEGVFEIHIRNINFVSGVKHFFATFIRDMESDLSFPIMNLLVIPFLYPLATFAILLSHIMTSIPADPLTRWLVGPVLFSILILPALFYLELNQRKTSKQYADIAKSKLVHLSLYTESEASEYSIQLTRRNYSEVIFNFTMYLLGVVTLLVVALSF